MLDKKQQNRHPLFWIPSVYFAMGLPLISIQMVLTVMYTDLQIPKEDIAFYSSFLTLPWSLKWIISPIMETIGAKRKYIIFTEIISAILFGAVVFALNLPQFFEVTLVLFGAIAFSGATHDIAGDGVYMDNLSNESQKVYSGWQGAFYNLAKVLANGGLVALAGTLVRKWEMSQTQAWQMIMIILALVLLAVGLYHMITLPKEQQKKSNETSFKEKMKELLEVFNNFFQKKYIIFYLFFIFMYRFAEGLTMKIAPIFLKDTALNGGLGLDNEQYGLIYGTYGAVAFISGSILSGYYISYFGLKRVLLSLACIFNIPFVVYLLMALYQPTQMWLISIGIVFEYFTYGFGFVGLTIFMMQQIAPGKYQMAHYAIATSLMNLGVMLPGMISGYLAEKKFQISFFEQLNFTSLMEQWSDYLGYPLFFILVMMMTIPAILITRFVPFTYDDSRK